MIRWSKKKMDGPDSYWEGVVPGGRYDIEKPAGGVGYHVRWMAGGHFAVRVGSSRSLAGAKRLAVKHLQKSEAQENPIAPIWWWVIGGVAVAGAATAAVVIANQKKTTPGVTGQNAPASLTSGEAAAIGNTLPASSSPSPSAPAAAPVTSVTLTSGAQTIPAAPGSTVTVNLPSGAQWGGSVPGLSTFVLTSPGASSITAPAAGTSTAATFTYAGGGSTGMAQWTDSSGTAQQTNLTVTG